MNTVKKLFAFMLALALVLSLAVPAMAAEEDHTHHSITINETNTGHQYIAYQIFDGEVHWTDLDTNPTTPTEKTLANVKWGKNVDTTNAKPWKISETETVNLTFVQALKHSTVNPSYYHLYAQIPETAGTIDGKVVTDDDIAADVAEALATGTNSAHGLEFARIVTPYLLDAIIDGVDHKAVTSRENQTNVGSAEEPVMKTVNYTIENLSDGYYLVKEGEANVVGETKTSYILQLIDSVSVNPKDGDVSVAKKIIEGGEPVDACSNNVGDTITFEINATMPSNLSDFSEFKLTFVDTMSDGLKLIENSVIVYTVNGDSVVEIKNEANKFYTVTENSTVHKNFADNKNASLVVDFPDLLALKTSPNYTVNSGTTIRLTYQALVTQDAVIGGNGNANEVYLKFSNDPYSTTSTGKTPKDEVHVLTFQLNIDKVNGQSGAPLEGVTFVVSRERHGQVEYAVLDSLVRPTPPASTPETTDSGSETKPPYGGKVLKWTNWLDEQAIVDHLKAQNPDITSDNLSAQKAELLKNYGVATVLTTAPDGKIYFAGLDLGVYRLIELETVQGFNTIDPIDFEIKGSYDTVNNKATGLQIIIDKVSTNGDNDEGTVTTRVVNNPGSTLPTTGGIGTTLFYVVGAAMVLGAIVLLVTKKRMSN